MSPIRIIALVVTGLIVTLLWEHRVLLPFKVLVVFIHEAWHGLVGLIGGGTVEGIVVTPDEAGETSIRGLSYFAYVLTVSAGYPGTMFTAAFLLNRGMMGKQERAVLGIFSIILIYAAGLFSAWGDQAFQVTLFWFMLFLGLAFYSQVYSRYALIITGTGMVWYCMYDLFDFSRGVEKTDAGALARKILGDHATGVKDLAFFISMFWIIIMGVILFFFIRPIYLDWFGKKLSDSAVNPPTSNDHDSQSADEVIPDEEEHSHDFYFSPDQETAALLKRENMNGEGSIHE